MRDMTTMQYDGITVLVRDGDYGRWDRGIVKETASEYLWDRMTWDTVRYAMDIGGHIGTWTLRAALHAPRARIVAVEPFAENYLLLALNLHDQLDRLTAVHGAVYYSDEPMTVCAASENSGAHVVKPTGGAPVETFTIERLMRQHRLPYLDVLKMDCEGSEHNILAQMDEETLANTHWIVGEHHCTADQFIYWHGARLRPHFNISFVPHPSKQVKDLGMFFLENRNWQTTVSSS